MKHTPMPSLYGYREMQFSYANQKRARYFKQVANAPFAAWLFVKIFVAWRTTRR